MISMVRRNWRLCGCRIYGREVAVFDYWSQALLSNNLTQVVHILTVASLGKAGEGVHLYIFCGWIYKEYWRNKRLLGRRRGWEWRRWLWKGHHFWGR